MKKLLIPLVILLLAVNSASAIEWIGKCTDNETLVLTADYEFNGTSNTFNQSIICQNGCENNLGKYGADCIEPDYLVILMVLGGIVFMFFLIAAIGRRK